MLFVYNTHTGLSNDDLIKMCVLYKTDYGKFSFNRIGGVLVSVLALSVVGRGFEP